VLGAINESLILNWQFMMVSEFLKYPHHIAEL